MKLVNKSTDKENDLMRYSLTGSKVDSLLVDIDRFTLTLESTDLEMNTLLSRYTIFLVRGTRSTHVFLRLKFT